MSRWNRFSIVITDGGSNDAAIMSVESLDVAVEREIFAVLVMTAVAHHMANVVEHCRGFQQNAGVRRQVMHGLQLVEEHDAEFAHVLGVLLVVFQPARKRACAKQDLALNGVVAVWLLARKRVARDFLGAGSIVKAEFDRARMRRKNGDVDAALGERDAERFWRAGTVRHATSVAISAAGSAMSR